VELLTTHARAPEVVKAPSVFLDLGWLLSRLLFELIDDLLSALVEWD
jgi:hypothetical protein